MVDSTDPNSADRIIEDALRDPGFQDQMAVAKDRGNVINPDSDLETDLRDMSYAGLRAKYGTEIARNRFRLSDGTQRLRDSDAGQRSVGEALSDVAVDAASALYRDVGNWGVLAAGYLEGTFDGDPRTTGSGRASELMQAHTAVVAGMKQENLTEELRDKQYFAQIEAELDSARNDRLAEAEVAAGGSGFMAVARREGRNALDALDRVTNQPQLAGSIIAEGIGSLFGSAPLAGAGGLVARGATHAVTRNALASRVATVVGSSSGAGVSEVTGVYSEAVNDVMGLDTDELAMTSPVMQELIAEGFTAEEAKIQLAGIVAETSAVRQIVPSLALGFITSKFESMPIGSFVNKGVSRGLLQIAGEGVEEAGQGVTGTYNRNVSVEQYAAVGRGAFEGVGEEAAIGALAGIGMAGVAATPSAAIGSTRSAAQAAADLFTETEPEFNDPLRNQIITPPAPGREAVKAVGKGVATVAGTTAKLTGKLVGKVSDAVIEYSEKPDNKEVTTSVEAAVDAKEVIQTEAQNGQLDESIEETVSQPDIDIPSEGLADVAGGERTIVENVAGILSKAGSKGVTLSDSDNLYAANQLKKLAGTVSAMSPEIKKTIGKILNSKVAKTILEKAKTVDMNRTDAEISVSDAVTIAKTNPANVDPEKVNKILEESGENIAPEDLKILQVASRLAQTVNENVDSQIAIREGENLSLVAQKRTKKPVKSVENTARSISAEGYTDSQGRPLRSINDFNSDILQGAQSATQTIVNDKGQVIPVRKVAESMQKFARHMQNKVTALNESLVDSYTNQQGSVSGKMKYFEGLRNGEQFVPAEQNSKGVRYSAGNPSSVAFAQQVALDQNTLIDSYNTLYDAFPEIFEGMERMEPVVLNGPELAGQQTPQAIEEISPSEIDEQNQTQETVSDEPVSTEATEADVTETVEETPRTIDEDTISEGGEIEAGADATDEISITEEIESEELAPTLAEMMEAETRTKADFDQLSEDELIESANEWFVEEEGMSVSKMPENRQAVMKALTDRIISNFGLPANLVTAFTWLTTPDKGHLGQAMWGERLIALKPGMVKALLGSKTSDAYATAKHVLFHEFMHLVDAYASDDVTKPASHSTNVFDIDPQNLGEVYAEVKALVESDPEWADFLGYAMSHDNIDQMATLASELTAEIGAVYLSDPDTARAVFPKGVKYVEKLIEQAGGAVTQVTDGDTTSAEVASDQEGTDQGSVGVTDKRQVHEKFSEVFTDKPGDPPIQNLSTFVSESRDNPKMNQQYLDVLEGILPEFMKRMNDRLQKKVTDKKISKTVAKHILSGRGIFTRFKAGLIMNPETETYDQNMLEMAGIAMMDFLSTATGSDPRRVDETLEKLEVNLHDMDASAMESVLYGMPPGQVKDTLAADLRRLWNVDENDNAAVNDLEGITHGFASEMLTVLDEMGIIQLEKIKLNRDDKANPVTVMVNTENLRDIQATITKGKGEGVSSTVRELVFREKRTTYSIGTKIEKVAKRQNRQDVALSVLERRALQKMQDTPHFLSDTRARILQAIGEENLMRILGYKDLDGIEHPVLRRSQLGKNASVRQSMLEVQELVDQLPDDQTPVYYPVGITKVGRHQYQGPNPQSNKLLRMLVTPTWSVLSLKNQKDSDNFWLAVAQASDLFKVEKRNHADILKEVVPAFTTKYGEAVQMMKDVLNGVDIDGAAFADLVGSVEPQVLGAIEAVASREIAAETGQDTFRTALSFELDGLTNGAANMMVNFGHGLMQKRDVKNLERVGLFLGSVGKTVNGFFSGGAKDLYETVSEEGDSMFARRALDEKPWQTEKKMAAGRLATAFGNFEMDPETGQFSMTRNTSKNPMTKVNYGSGVRGVAIGVADDMLLTFYEKLQDIPENADWDVYFYNGVVKDLALVGLDIPSDIQKNFEFSADQVDNFRTSVQFTIGKILTEATRSVLGKSIIELTDMMTFSTNIQANYVKLMFDKELDLLAEKLAAEGVIERTAKGVPQKGQIPRKYFKELEKQMSQLAPIFVSDDQTLAIEGFDKKPVDGLRLSSTFDETLATSARMARPDDVGVRAIPFTVIGTGDAMMMNLIFGGENAPTDALGIFDGLDIPVSKIAEYGALANQQVLRSWERDVIGMVVSNFEGFLDNDLDQDVLAQAFSEAGEKTKKESIQFADSNAVLTSLKDRLMQTRARKKVMKRLAVSVDQMGGSEVGFSREGEELRYDQINHEIEKEMTNAPETEDVRTPVVESTAKAILSGLRLNAAQKEVAKILAPLLGETRVIMGTLNQMNQYRQENLPDDGSVLRAKGQYDVANDIIWLSVGDPETVLHEMVHAATYARVLEHYEGNANEAVSRLQDLLGEFLQIEEASSKVREAQASILRELSTNTPAGKAAALNEFMAYSLSSAQVRADLKSRETSTIQKLAQKVIQLMKRIMGGIPTNMFDQVVFNTRVLNQPPIDDGAGDGGNGDGGDGGTGGESTPPAREFTNYWIETLKSYMAERVRLQDAAFVKTGKALWNAQQVINNFRQVGMLSNNEDRATFRAIYGIMLSDMKLDSNGLIALTKVFNHVEKEMTPDMFGTSAEARQEYSAVLNSFGDFKVGDTSDAVAVLFALSQTSTKFRAVLDQIPAPEGDAAVEGSLNDFLTKGAAFAMKKLTGSLETQENVPADVLATISEMIVDHDTDREYRALSHVTGSLDAADKYVSGKLQAGAERMRRIDQEVQNSTRSKVQKSLVAAVTFATNFLDKTGTDLTAQAAKKVTHMGLPVLSIIQIRELVSELIGTDRQNQDVVGLLDRVNSQISGMRQAYREDLPGILEREFNVAPDADQWTSMYNTLAKTDFTSLINLNNMQQSMQLLEEGARLTNEIQRVEGELQQKLSATAFNDAVEKAEQLAAYMNGEGAGKLLMRNAYAIAKNLEGGFDQGIVDTLDRLITLYAMQGMDPQMKEDTVQLWQNEPSAMIGLVSYIQGLNEAEDGKPGITEAARLNAYKGYIPNEGVKNLNIIIGSDDSERAMNLKGYVKMGPYEGEILSIFPQSYYVSTVRRQGMYSQGVMQNVAQTYRGVDVNTGLTVNGSTAGWVSGEDGTVGRMVDTLNDPSYVLSDPKETMLPVLDEDGAVMGFERAINPDVFKQHLKPDENLAVMLGAWAGRHIEETLADQYNKELVDHLDNIWTNRETGDEQTFVNLKSTDDPIYAESFKLIPQSTKNYIDTKFDGEGFMVPLSMVNLSVGYREASLADMWSGKTRLPKGVQAAVKASTEAVMGRNAMRWLSGAEEVLQGTVSTAKDIIVIRSLVVPFANMQANALQLVTRGVPTKTIAKSFRQKLAEVEQYNANVSKMIELKAKVDLAARNSNQRKILQDRIQVIEDLNAKMSIAPMIEAGAYKQLSEGITDMDVDISKGRIGDWVETAADKYLPERLADIAHVGLVSKSTRFYKAANRATQYGDFLAKSIYYDHLLQQGLGEAEALAKMNEEFVNFSALPGRTRSYLEGVGLTWFMAFKIRIAKIAMQQMRENPVRALALNSVFDVGSPIQDNIFTVINEGRLDYATGYEMLFDAPELNPWLNLISE